MDELLEPLSGRRLFVFHPSFGYLARRYGLEQVAVEVGGKAPSPRQLSELVEQVQASGSKTIFVQPQFAHRPAEAVAEAAGCDLVELDPLAEDHLANLERMAETIATALGGGR
jgi:zinc transport system substrate-binding protein